VSFEVIFHEYSDDIFMQYRDVNFGDVSLDAGAASTVGLQRDGSYGQQYLCYEALLSNQMGIRWYRDVADEPTISLSTTSLRSNCEQGLNAPSRSFVLWNSGIGALSYTISDDADWLWCDPVSGASTGEHDTIAANFSTSGLTMGEYSATITVSDPGAVNSPQYIAVSLTIDPPTYTLTTSVSPAGAGWVSGAGTYEMGEIVTVQAYPNQDWVFDHWEGDDIDGSTQNPEQVTMDFSKSVTAVFAPPSLNQISLSYPQSGAMVYETPTFTWTANAGEENVFVVDMALGNQIYKSSRVGAPSWTMPNAAWSQVPSGSLIYWRVRGADTAPGPPYAIIASDEIWWFYKW
jgi:hypothetical protein